MTQLTDKVISCIQFNARSLNNKLSEFAMLTQSLKYDIIVVTESWLTKKITDELLCPEQTYNIYRCDRNSRGGGVCILIRKQISCLRLPQITDIQNVEYVAIDLIMNNQMLRFITVYLPPRSDANKCTATSDIITKYCKVMYPTVIVGDFNLPTIDWNTLTASNACHNILLDCFLENDFHQFVCEPTFTKALFSENILDLVLSNDLLSIIDVKVDLPFSTSDHNSVVSKYLLLSMKKRRFHISTTLKLILMK